jgi:hypothetical protein
MISNKKDYHNGQSIEFYNQWIMSLKRLLALIKSNTDSGYKIRVY